VIAPCRVRELSAALTEFRQTAALVRAGSQQMAARAEQLLLRDRDRLAELLLDSAEDLVELAQRSITAEGVAHAR
jgi:hypothetical protein